MHIIDILLQNQQNSKTIEELYNTFDKIVCKNASEFQRQALKLAFMAGAGSTMMLLKRQIVLNQTSEEEADKKINSIMDDLKVYIAQTDRSRN